MIGLFSGCPVTLENVLQPHFQLTGRTVALLFKLCPWPQGKPCCVTQNLSKSSDSHSTSTLSSMGQFYSATWIKKQFKPPLGEME